MSADRNSFRSLIVVREYRKGPGTLETTDAITYRSFFRPRFRLWPKFLLRVHRKSRHHRSRTKSMNDYKIKPIFFQNFIVIAYD